MFRQIRPLTWESFSPLLLFFFSLASSPSSTSTHIFHLDFPFLFPSPLLDTSIYPSLFSIEKTQDSRSSQQLSLGLCREWKRIRRSVRLLPLLYEVVFIDHAADRMKRKLHLRKETSPRLWEEEERHMGFFWGAMWSCLVLLYVALSQVCYAMWGNGMVLYGIV